jgi:hypothetical protein
MRWNSADGVSKKATRTGPVVVSRRSSPSDR